MPPRLRPGRRAGRAADAVRAARRASLRARIDGLAPAADDGQGGSGAAGLPHGHARGRADPGPVRLPPLDQLPLGGRPRPRPPGDGPGREAPRPGRPGRQRRGRPLGRLTARQRQGTRRHRRDPHRPRRGLREGAHGRGERRARGPRPPHWAGVVPLRKGYETPISDAELAPGTQLPGYLEAL